MRRFMAVAKALSDENRVRVLLMLRHGELCVCQIIELLQLAPSTVSKHLTLLEQAELIQREKRGKWHYYRLAATPPECAAQAQRWVLNALSGDARIKDDDRRRKAVLKREVRELCALYRS